MDHRFLENIDSYLQGDLSLAELKRIASEEGIRNPEEEIRWFKNATLAIEAEGLKAQLKDLYDQEVKQDSPIKKDEKKPGKVINLLRGKFLSYSIAASLLIAFGLFFFLRPSEHQNLYSEYEYIDPGIPLLMSESNRYELYDALTYYSEQDYGAAIKKFLALDYDGTTFKDTAEFYLGASYLYSGLTYDCLPLFESVSSGTPSAFSERADWLTALALLKAGEIDGTTNALENILTNPNHTFYDQAQSLSARISE